MRENVRDRDRLEHIVEAIDRILAFADGKTREELEADDAILLDNSEMTIAEQKQWLLDRFNEAVHKMT